MRLRFHLWFLWAVFSLVGGAGCGGAPPRASALEEIRSAAPASLLLAQELPAPPSRRAGPESPGSPLFLAGHEAGLFPPDISPDGQQVLLASNDGAVSVIDMTTGTTRAARRMWTSPARGGLRDARFDATGTRVLLIGAGPPYRDTLFMWDLLSDALVPGQAMGIRSVSHATFAADGRLVVATAEGMLEVRDAGTLVVERTMALRAPGGEPLNPGRVWVSPTTTRIIAVRDASLDLQSALAGGLSREPLPTLLLYGGDGQFVTELMPAIATQPAGEAVDEARSDEGSPRDTTPGFRSASFRPGGGMLATVTTAGLVQLRHPESGATLLEPVLPGRAREALWTRDGALLLVLDGDHDHQVHFVEPSSGARVATVTMSSPQGWPLDSIQEPDGGVLVFSEREANAFSRTGEARPHPLAPFGDITQAGSWFVRLSADGARAVVVQDDTIHTLDLERGVRLAQRTVSAGPRSVWGAVFVPGGVLMTNRESGVLFRANRATTVFCAGADTRLVGQGATQRVVGPAATCGLGDAAQPETTDSAVGERDYVASQSADGTTRVVVGENQVSVQDARTGRVRMRVLASDRTVPGCDECGVNYSLSPDGRTLAVYEIRVPFTLFDTRSGRRVVRLETPGRTASWLSWNRESSAFAVLFSPVYDAEAAADAVPTSSLLAAYDHRGRELVSVASNPDDLRGGVGAELSSTHVALFQGSRASVVELSSRTVTTLALASEAIDAEWLGPALRLTVLTEDGTRQLLFAPGATTPYFQHDGAGTFTPDARSVFRCRDGELERLRVEDLARTSFGPCLDSELFPSDDGRFVAQPHGDHLRVVREDGVAIRLSALSDLTGVTAFAVEEATGRFTTLGTPLENERYRYRQPGPAIRAPVVRASEAGAAVDAQVLERFFGAPETRR